MSIHKTFQSWDLYLNGHRIKRYYSKNKAIDIAQRESANLFLGHMHIEVVDSITGEIIYNT